MSQRDCKKHNEVLDSYQQPIWELPGGIAKWKIQNESVPGNMYLEDIPEQILVELQKVFQRSEDIDEVIDSYINLGEHYQKYDPRITENAQLRTHLLFSSIDCGEKKLNPGSIFFTINEMVNLAATGCIFGGHEAVIFTVLEKVFDYLKNKDSLFVQNYPAYYYTYLKKGGVRSW